MHDSHHAFGSVMCELLIDIETYYHISSTSIINISFPLSQFQTHLFKNGTQTNTIRVFSKEPSSHMGWPYGICRLHDAEICCGAPHSRYYTLTWPTNYLVPAGIIHRISYIPRYSLPLPHHEITRPQEDLHRPKSIRRRRASLWVDRCFHVASP